MQPLSAWTALYEPYTYIRFNHHYCIWHYCCQWTNQWLKLIYGTQTFVRAVCTAMNSYTMSHQSCHISNTCISYHPALFSWKKTIKSHLTCNTSHMKLPVWILSYDSNNARFVGTLLCFCLFFIFCFFGGGGDKKECLRIFKWTV